MEWDGDEKRIRALFSELSFEDQNRTPRFEKLWRRPEASSPARTRGLATPITAFAVLVILIATAFGLWSLFTTTPTLPQQLAVDVTPQSFTTTGPPEQKSNQASLVRIRSHSHRQQRLTRRSPVERLNTAEAAQLSAWQSPTAGFLESPAGTVFNSLPQLNQSVEDLRSFLPKNNQMLKESNQ
jgi:hypothetical protein